MLYSYIDEIKSDDRNNAAASAIDGPAVLIVDRFSFNWKKNTF